MKKIFLLSIIALFFISCNNNEEEIQKLQAQSDSLQAEISNRDKTVDDFFKSFNDIQNDLNNIKEKENILTISTNLTDDPSESQKEQIKTDIEALNQLIQKNKDKINRLSRQLRNSNINIKELKKTIENLKKVIEEKTIEIDNLNKQIEGLNITISDLSQNIDSLNIENEQKDNTINQKDNEINTAFYVFGSKKELLEHKVVTKDGGFVGLGKVIKLQQDFNKDYFTKIDITKDTKFDLYAKSAKIITTHPSGTYKFIKNNKTVESIVITNPKEFWSTSKYLVIVVD